MKDGTRVVVGFPGYVISREGKIWSSRLGRNQAGDPRTPVLRSIALIKNNHGHLFVHLYRGNGIKHKRYIHRLVAEAFIGPCPEGMECRHLDGDPANNNSDNLAWGTKIENQADRILHGTSNKGTRNGQSKLTESEVIEIRVAYRKGNISQEALGKLYDVSGGAVSRIINKKHYADVQGES